MIIASWMDGWPFRIIISAASAAAVVNQVPEAFPL
jgi:hypothetical protein